MILKNIQVSHWRSLLDKVSVGPFSEGINVIQAPNGTGKSSLFEAMRRGLFDAHHVSGGEIASVQPWGRDLTPSVTLEFTEGGETWRVEKSFLSEKAARLSRLEGSSFQPVADGRKADDRIREILAADAPGRGLSKQEHWGLAQILWAPQGELPLSQISGNASESLKAALGVQISGNSGGQIEESIARRYGAFFTKKGTYKSGKHAAPLLSLQEKRDQLAARLISLREKHTSYEQSAHTVEDARQRRLQARREADALRETVAETRGKAEAYANLKTEKSNRREAEALAKEKFDSLTNRRHQITETRQLLDQLTASLREQAERVDGLKKEEALARETLATRRTARETVRAKRGTVAERQKVIEAAREFLTQSENLEALRKRIDAVADLQDQQAKAKERLQEILPPTPELLRNLRSWITKRDKAAAALKASQIHMEISPEIPIKVTNATNEQSTAVDAGESASFAGDNWVDVTVAGFGSIRASGPEGSAGEHRKALNKASAKIDQLTQPFGNDDPEKLQLLRDKADQLNHAINARDERIRDLLNGEEWDDLKTRRMELQARMAELGKRHPQWQNQPPVLNELQQDQETFSQAVEDEIIAAEDACERAQSQHNAADKAVTDAVAEQKVLQSKLEAAQDQLKELCRDGLSDEARKEAADQALLSWQAAKTAAEKAEEALAQFPDDPGKELSKQQKQLAALEEAEARARDEEKTAEGLLQSLAAEGTFSQLVAAEEEQEALQSSIEEESIRMDAIKLLHETVSACRNRMVASVSAPVERHATRMLARIVGPRLGQLKLTGDFVPHAVSPTGAPSPVALHHLSGGEQEQLYLVARLALAEVLAKDQRQLVVLDDVLNATDSGRLARLLSLVEEVSERLQVIILTCQPERYRGFDSARFFELK